MPRWHDFDYALYRLVPDVTSETAWTVGVVMHSRTAGVAAAHFRLNEETLAPLDADLLYRYMNGIVRVVQGGEGSGPIGRLPASERFHWATAPRSTVLQPGPVHGGRSADPGETFETLVRRYLVSDSFSD